MKNIGQAARDAVKNEKGFATIEGVVLLIVFAVILTYAIGFFGVVHTGIKNSIASRALAFETFRNRANLSYRRDYGPLDNYKTKGFRYHHVMQENVPATDTPPMWATDRKITYVRGDEDRRGSSATAPEADPVWIKTRYGICLNGSCGN